jgi:hypothetical protein
MRRMCRKSGGYVDVQSCHRGSHSVIRLPGMGSHELADERREGALRMTGCTYHICCGRIEAIITVYVCFIAYKCAVSGKRA